MIIFENKGELDINAVRMMGVSIKDDSAIGMFGTGLKYALAVLLREGQSVVIYSGMSAYHFGVEPVDVRGKSFNAITMNGERLAFTTELGKTWEMWMAFRELYANCRDEHGTCYEGGVRESSITTGPKEGYTVIAVKGDKFRAEFFNRQVNFIEGVPKFSDGTVEIFDRPSSYLFYKGVRVLTLRNPSQFTYNIVQRMTLSEDRQLSYWWEADAIIARAAMKMVSEADLYRILTAAPDTFERVNLNFSGNQYSEEFSRVAIREYKSNPLRVNASVRKFVDALNLSNLHETARLSAVQEAQLRRATEFCKKIGYDASEYMIVVVETLGPTMMAQVRRAERQIVLSKQCFDKGTKYIASTLIEEVIHLREDLADETRGLQTYLFDKIISLGEEIMGEPL